MHDVAHDAIHYFTHADKGLLHLIRSLATKTGEVAREFCDGRRKTYFSPLNFFLITIAVSFFIFSLDDGRAIVESVSRDQLFNSYSDPARRAFIERFMTRMQSAMLFLRDYYKLSYMVSLPVYTLFYWLMFRRERFNFAEHLVANLYMQGFAVLVSVPIQGLTVINPAFFAPLNFTIMLFQFLYFSVFYYKFMGLKGSNGQLLAPAVTFVALLLTYGMMVVGLAVYCLWP